MSARQGVVGQRSERVSGFDGGGWEREVVAAAAEAAAAVFPTVQLGNGLERDDATSVE